MLKIFKNLLFKLWLLFNPLKKPIPIFIMSHMRSGSSLLEHILATNKEILGVGEQNRKYLSYINIKRMELFSRWNSNSLFKSYTYVIDQVLHSELTPNKLLFNDIKIVFLIREPSQTITSIENLNSNHYGIKSTDNKNAIEYYLNRLNYLISISKDLKKRNLIFLTYNQLVNNSNETLNSLSDFLNLKEPLKKTYKTKKYTGIFGDNSENIKKGTILKLKKRVILLNTNDQKKITSIYNKTKEHFNKLKSQSN